MKKPDLKGFLALVWFLIAATLLPQFNVAEWTIIVWFSPFFWIMICAFLWHFAVGSMNVRCRYPCVKLWEVGWTPSSGEHLEPRIARHHSSLGFKSPRCIEVRELWGAICSESRSVPLNAMVTSYEWFLSHHNNISHFKEPRACVVNLWIVSLGTSRLEATGL